jgi:hypothetical protein
MLRLALVLAAASTSAHALEVECEPTVPFFCMNIHAGCAGRTDLPAPQFKLNADAGRGWIESADTDMRDLYANGRAEWNECETRVLVRPERGQGYIRLLVDGRYVFRYYRADTGIMSYGNCR